MAGLSGGGSSRKSIRVLIADDHPMVRQGLRVFLELEPDLEVVGEASDGAEAAALTAELLPDVVLLDLVMPGVDGLTALETLAEQGLAERALVVTSFGEYRSALPALRAGARGYISKDVDPAALATAVRAVAAGHVLLGPQVTEALVAQAGTASAANLAGEPQGPQLTAREREVLEQIAAGRSNREIAKSLQLAEKTVKTHVSNVLMKLGVADRTQAALWAVRHEE
nr:response regulator transcription factor [Actinospica acidithermotolerans]